MTGQVGWGRSRPILGRGVGFDARVGQWRWLGIDGGREAHGDHQTFAGRGRRRDRPAVSGHYGGHDGQTEPAAAPGAGPGRVGPVEALEDAPGVLVAHAGAAVPHLDLRLVPDLVDVHRGGRPRRRVRSDIGQQIVQDLAQAVLVADDFDRSGRRELHGPIGSDRGGGPYGLGGQPDQLDGRHLHRHPLVKASQRKEIADQPVHAGGLGADARHNARQVIGTLGSASLEQLGVGRYGGDRRAELVGGVGDELAQVLLVLPQTRLRGDARGERRLNPLEHHVEGTGQPAHLGGLIRPGDTLVEVTGRDGVSRPFHVLERT